MDGIADFILILHLIIAIFISAGMVIFPIGGLLSWRWCNNFSLRVTHLGLIVVVFIETLIGVNCPLTVAENYFRAQATHQSFIGSAMNNLLYWNVSESLFFYFYGICVVWALLLWILFPPSRNFVRG